MLLNVRFGNTCVKMRRIRTEKGIPEKTQFSTYPYKYILIWDNKETIRCYVIYEEYMNNRDTIVSLSCAFLLLIAAAVVNHLNLWSLLGNFTVPWFCSTIAIALLIVTLTGSICGCPPSQIPLSRVITVIVGSSAVIGLGMLVDGASYNIPMDWASTAGEWFGFSISLIILFWLPRTDQTNKQIASPKANWRTLGYS